MGTSLNKEQKKFMEYFWNSKLKKANDMIPTRIICYMEKEDIQCLSNTFALTLINQKMQAIEKLGLIKAAHSTVNGVELWELSLEGHLYLRSKHPKFKEFLLKAISNSHPVILIISGIISFLGSIYGVIEFTNWVLKKT